jgi:hypothetical protein
LQDAYAVRVMPRPSVRDAAPRAVALLNTITLLGPPRA